MIRTVKFVVCCLAIYGIGIIGSYVIEHKLESMRAMVMYNTDPATAKVRQAQLDCLAHNIYYEAGYEPFEGKVAIAQVTINRTENSNFPSDICKVVYQKNIVYEKVLCQFSWYCEKHALLVPKGPAYVESMEVAKRVLLEGFRLPSLTKALYFHGDYINPNWKKEKVAHIGRHVFYK